MSQYTKQDIIKMVEKEDVEFIRLQFVDLYGNLKNMAVTNSQLDKVLSNRCSFDCGAIEGFDGLIRPELLLYPDLDTFEIFPWRPQQGKVARLICDVYTPDGKPFEGDSRYVLKKAIAKAKEMGYQIDVGPECEFFLFDLDEAGNETTDTKEKGSYFDIGPIDSGENARREMVLFLEDMGFEIESSFHADAPAQHEIDFKYDNALQSADNIVTFKLVVRTVARRHGLNATFMPKPKSGVKGSGMHINISLQKDGKNVFAGKDGVSEIGKQFIVGILKHVRGMSLITNPIVNSYKRLVPGFGAPVYIGWSQYNRSPLIRVNNLGDENNRIELRSPDAAANPYLALAVCIAAGLQGVKEAMDVPESIEEDYRNMSEEELMLSGIEVLPGNLGEAIAAFEEDEFVKDVLGEHITQKYLQMKKREWKEYCVYVSPWETEKYLTRI